MQKKVLQAMHNNMKRALNSGNVQAAHSVLDALKQQAMLAVETRGFELELMLLEQRYEEAEKLARQLMEQFPLSAKIHFCSARLQYTLKSYDKAASFFRESDRIHPHWQTQRWLGKTLTQQGKLLEAEAFVNGLIKTTEPDAYTVL